MNGLNLYGGGGQPDRAIVRQTMNTLARVDAAATIQHAKAAAVGNVGAAAIGMVGNLSELATQVVKQTPTSAPYVEMTLRTVVITMSGIVTDLGRM